MHHKIHKTSADEAKTGDAPVTTLPGVGPERAALLGRLDITILADLLSHRPRRYEDRRRCQAIVDLKEGDVATVQAKVVASGVKRWQRGRRSVFELIVEDDSGRLYAKWWNQPYREQQFKVGEELWLYGRVTSRRPLTMEHPETENLGAPEEEAIHLHRVVPIYPLTEGLGQRWLRALIWRTLPQCRSWLMDPEPNLAPDDFPSRFEAFEQLHFPDEPSQAEQARRRLAFDEYAELHRMFVLRRRNLRQRAGGLICRGDNRWVRPFLQGLGFELTAAQTRVLRELRRDLQANEPMRRLLQGDVGAGKTVVAAACALMVLESGYDVVLMAPTEILAAQHQRTFEKWLQPLDIPVHLVTGKRRSGQSPERPGMNSASANVSLTVGTHALIESGFVAPRLGLVVIDEQHKFGVAQRERLVRKGSVPPHVLVMTATPIPRTLGLTLYGDLDVSVLDALPPGRGRVRTFVRSEKDLTKVWPFIRKQCAAGHRAYVVYSRVEATGREDLKAVTTEFERLRDVLAPHRVGLLHGRLSSEAKETVMAAFRSGETQVLVASSVVEVGLDVPEATVMVIENAERFGLAQLHQLRGRIRRGGREAYCILVANLKSTEVSERLRLLETTDDGFRVAEADLQFRGPGELLGREQSGLPPFRFGELSRDADLLAEARRRVREDQGPEPV